MIHFPKKYNSLWPWTCCVMYFNYILMIDWMTFADGLATNSNENHTNNLGWIYPKSEVHILRGKPLKIFCTISLESEEIKNYGIHLTFQKDGQILNVTRVNETTISLDLPNEKVSDSVHKCYLISNKTNLPTSAPSISSNSPTDNVGETAINKSHFRSLVFNLPSKILIDHIRVLVGERPSKPKNLTCMSHNWNFLSCSWVMQEDCGSDHDTIWFVPLNSTSTTPIICPFQSYKTECERTCIWSDITNPPYSHNFERLKITVTVKNAFDKTQRSFYFNKFKHVILDTPRSLMNVSQSTTSVYLQWYMNDLRGIHMIHRDWTCHVLVESVFLPSNMVMEILNGKSPDTPAYYAANITGLRPNTEYTFRVRMKPPAATLKYWSDYSNKLKCRTDPLTRPVFPKTDYSLFEITKSNESFRTINIYWKPVTDKDQYDSKMKYKTDLYNIDQTGKKVLVESRVHAVNSDDFTDSYRIGNLSHQFVITSAVSDGNASNTSTSIINVPTTYNRVTSLALVYAIYYDYYNDTSVIEWKWKPPKEQQNIVSYTPFWYWRITNSFYMDWAHVTTEVTQRQISTGDFLYKINYKESMLKSLPRCYISVNTQYYSSGLVQMPILHSVSHIWSTEWFSKKKPPVKSVASVDSKPVTNVGWKISPLQLQKWFSKLYGTSL